MESNKSINEEKVVVKRKLRIPYDVEEIKSCFKNVDIDSIKFEYNEYANEFHNKYYSHKNPVLSIFVDEMRKGKVYLGDANICVISDKIINHIRLDKLGYDMDAFDPYHFVVWHKRK